MVNKPEIPDCILPFLFKALMEFGPAAARKMQWKTKKTKRGTSVSDEDA
jgi:hypothetical protein